MWITQWDGPPCNLAGGILSNFVPRNNKALFIHSVKFNLTKCQCYLGKTVLGDIASVSCFYALFVLLLVSFFSVVVSFSFLLTM